MVLDTTFEDHPIFYRKIQKFYKYYQILENPPMHIEIFVNFQILVIYCSEETMSTLQRVQVKYLQFCIFFAGLIIEKLKGSISKNSTFL